MVGVCEYRHHAVWQCLLPVEHRSHEHAPKFVILVKISRKPPAFDALCALQLYTVAKISSPCCARVVYLLTLNSPLFSGCRSDRDFDNAGGRIWSMRKVGSKM